MRLILFLTALSLGCNGTYGDSGELSTDDEPSESVEPADTDDPVEEDPAFDAEGFFQASCTGCHGADGTGTDSGPDLTGRVPSLSDDEVSDAILNGPGGMPSFSDTLDDTEVTELVDWLRAEFG